MIISGYDDITVTPVSLPPLSLGDPGDGGGHREEEGGDPQGPVQGQHPHLVPQARLSLVTLQHEKTDQSKHHLKKSLS